MHPRRVALPPPVAYSSKASLDAAAQSDINGILKQLKACTRRLQTAYASHALELQVLERLYYKGKNQHRTALFWRSVVEIRRYGARVEEMELYGLVERMRVSFWGEAALQNTKLLKGPWTHHPDAVTVMFVLQRCSEACSLLKKAQERLSAAYHSLTLVMQTAAFLQLVLTLVAITSKFSSLLTEIQSCMELARVVCYQMLQLIDPELARKESRSLPSEYLGQETTAASQSQTEALLYSPDRTVTVDEDVGSVLVRRVTRSVVELPRAPVPPADATPTELSPPLLEDLNMVSPTIVTTVRTISARENGAPSNGGPPQIAQKRKNESTTLQKKAKKKKKRDEIDDIFGL
ncbi:uncharacterized protein C8Q71DRAFT_221077 [Rhodofomes roseus]|uniref:Nucleolus and neural progenitor protein-like N-terminal domain-containing protein n=1 Tax=Rhodofomes roseus TaxID=34475 RepID=A0ABQ8KWV5_9APHY|nr:uncharacterized protein C8Q71DRAFT_221077 [Rhodofomes roseus]KAH9842785.1 hypothetical protein C8Q71DRAFT_221077 [Rhodofomes roseus]